MFTIKEATATTRRVVCELATFEAAEQRAKAMGSLYLERDADHAGCADFITKGGDVYCIEPVGFTLAREG